MTTIAIVGRPNTGKSTLFNRLIRKRVSITASASGVTRDRIYGKLEWCGCKFTLVDTGGVDFDDSTLLKKQIQEQIRIAVSESQLIVFVVDVKSGITPMDEEVGRLLRKSGKTVVVAVNKVDNNELLKGVSDFFGLGWDTVIGISSLHGIGINILLDAIRGGLPSLEEDVSEEEPLLRVAIVGRPNTGKSTFINTVCKKPRMIVDEIPGTTRDAVDIKIIRDGRPWLFIDTGGIRKGKKLKSAVDYYSQERVYKAIERATVVVLMVDAWEGIVVEDAKLLNYITEKGKGCVIAVNKWDIVTLVTKREYMERIQRRLPKHSFVPAVFVSSLKGENIDKLLLTVEHVYKELQIKLPTKSLNKLLHRLEKTKIYYGTQIGSFPPAFLLFVKEPREIRHTELSHIANELRKSFGFSGVPIRWKLRKR